MTMFFQSAALESATDRRRSGMMFSECVSPPWQREQYTRYGSAPAAILVAEKICSGGFGGGAGPGPGGSVALPSSLNAKMRPELRARASASLPPEKPRPAHDGDVLLAVRPHS